MFRALTMSELMKALASSDHEEAERILESVPSEVSIRDRDGRVALHYAAETMPLEMVHRILEEDPSLVDCEESDGYTPLTMAVMGGRTDVSEFLLHRGASVNHLDREGHTAIHWAVVCGQLETLSYIVDQGADINIPDRMHATALHYSTSRDDYPSELTLAILLTLLRKGANPNAKDIDERTPLMWAASNGNIDAIIPLKQSGGDLLAVDRDGIGVLHCAASRGHVELVELLLKQMPSGLVDMKDRAGHTPLYYAVAYGHIEAARFLLSCDANPNHQDLRLRTPSHCAASKGQVRMLKLLKQFGATFEYQNYRGDLPLHEATQAGSKETVEWLLTLHPSTADSQNHEGRTALHISAATGNIELVIFLCAQGAEINPLMLYKGTLYTPLDLARKKDHQVVVDYLKMRYEALTADEIPDDQKNSMKNIIEERVSKAKLRRGRKMRNEASEEDSSDRKIRRRRTTHDMNIQTSYPNLAQAETNTSTALIGRSSSAESRPCLPKSTSTTDLTFDKENRDSSRNFMEGRIEAIVREEMRAARWPARQRSKKQRKQQERDLSLDDEGLISDEDKSRTPSSIGDDRSIGELSQPSRDHSGQPSARSDEDEGLEEMESDDERSEASSTKENEKTTDASKKGTFVYKKRTTDALKVEPTKTTSILANGKKKNGKEKGKIRIQTHKSIPEEDSFDIFEEDWDELDGVDRNTGKEVQRRYIHEKAIFQELTHLKRMQIQYGKVQEKILVHTLVANFCKMHGLNPSNFKIQSFFAWERYLYDQLKQIYTEERERLLTVSSTTTPKMNPTARLSRFETRLRQARAVPLNDRIKELTRIYGNSTMNGGKATRQRSAPHAFPGQKRCDCLGKHLLVK